MYQPCLNAAPCICCGHKANLLKNVDKNPQILQISGIHIYYTEQHQMTNYYYPMTEQSDFPSTFLPSLRMSMKNTFKLRPHLPPSGSQLFGQILWPMAHPPLFKTNRNGSVAVCLRGKNFPRDQS